MNIYQQIDSNKKKTWLIMFLFVALSVGLSWIFSQALGYGSGADSLGFVGLALVIGGFINLAGYYWSDKMVLSLVGAKPINKEDTPELFRIVENLSIGAGVPVPKVYLVNDPSPNAFATGRDPKNAALAVHTGLLQRLEKLELEGVIAHELSHIRNFDTRVMAIVAILAGTLAMLANFFLRTMMWGGKSDSRDNRAGAALMLIGIIAAILAPIAAQLIQLSVSRRREYLADASGALLTRYPEGLADALEKISTYKSSSSTASAGMAHLYFTNPLGSANKVGSWISGLFNTHPPIAERIKILRQM